VLGVSRDRLEELPEGVSVGVGDSLEAVARDDVEPTEGVVRRKLASAPGVSREILLAVEGVRRGMLPSEVGVRRGSTSEGGARRGPVSVTRARRGMASVVGARRGMLMSAVVGVMVDMSEILESVEDANQEFSKSVVSPGSDGVTTDRTVRWASIGTGFAGVFRAS